MSSTSWTVRGTSLLLLGCCLFDVPDGHAQALLTLEHHVVGAHLEVSPTELYVPKDIPGSISVNIATAEGQARTELSRIGHGAHIEATLRGPNFPAFRLLGLPNEPLILPPIAVAGEYQIDDIRLVAPGSQGEVLMMGAPSHVPVHVFPEVLVSQVSSRPLTLDEIRDRGIVIDSDSFGAVEFQATFILDGKSFPVWFPVVAPKFKESLEIISRAELEERFVYAERLNREIGGSLRLPEEMRRPGLNISIQGLNFQRAVDGDEERKRLLPSIPAMLVIPGHIGFLNQFFSVQVFTANASPEGSNLSVHEVRATINLPQPSSGGPPLAVARIGPNAVQTTEVAIKTFGPDNVPETADDQGRLEAGQTGRGEFVLEGKREGLHVFDIELAAILDGYAHGEVPIAGHVSGSVLVRNPKFSIAFSHPSRVRDGEPYAASLTITNTSETDAELVTVNLHEGSLSGTELLSPADGIVSLGTIPSGESRTATYQFRSERTGSVRFTNLTGDHGLSGRFDLTMAVDDRGVELDPNAIGYPDWVDGLAPEVFAAANRVLGQALSVSTAAILPPGVRRLSKDLVRTRVLELAEAGQRLRYLDDDDRVYLDLLLDFHGGRTPSLGFDQIMSATHEFSAGLELRQALVEQIELSGAESGLDFIERVAANIAARHEAWGVAASNNVNVVPLVEVNGLSTGGAVAELSESGAYRGTYGWFVPVRAPHERESPIEVSFRIPAGNHSGTVSWLSFDGDGAGTRSTFQVVSDPNEPVCYRHFPRQAPNEITVDVGCQRRSSATNPVDQTATITEEAPFVRTVIQDLQPLILRPVPPCGGPRFNRFGKETLIQNYGTVVAVLFSKPMDADLVERPGAFQILGGRGTNGVKVQPGGRVALVNLQEPIGDFVHHELVLSGIEDLRGQGLADTQHPIAALPGETLARYGVAVNGRVIGVDGLPAVNVPVTLIMNDSRATPTGCVTVDVRQSQTRTDALGRFDFDFVLAGIHGYTVAATDTRGFDQDVIDFLLEASPNGPLDPEELERLASVPGRAEAFQALFGGQDFSTAVAIAESVDRATFQDSIGPSRIGATVPVSLRFRGRGTVEGTVFENDGVTPVAGAAVNLYPDPTSRELRRGVYTNANGRFVFPGVPLGAVRVQAEANELHTRIVASRLNTPGETLRLDIVLSTLQVPTGELEGRVFEVDGVTPHPHARLLIVDADGNGLALTQADDDGRYRFEDVPVPYAAEVFAVSADGRHGSYPLSLGLQAGITTFLDVALRGTSSVAGRVVFDNGAPAPFAKVAGGDAVVEADAQGFFLLTGVPVGRSAISAALEPNHSQLNSFVRFGDAAVDVLPNAIAQVLVRLRPAGRIEGRVFNGTVPHANVRVALTVEDGFYWVDADANGFYRFDNIPLGEYIMAAPAPPVTDDEGNEIPSFAMSPEEQLRAALGGVQALFARGGTEPEEVYLPGSYGFAKARLDVDGATARADIRYLPAGIVDGRALNEIDVPLSARVTLQGTRPKANGAPAFKELSTMNSDPTSGEFSFGGLFLGRWALTASSPFYSRPATAGGETTLAGLNVEDVELKFTRDVPNGRIAGTVLIDGEPASSAVLRIIESPLLEAEADEQGRFESIPLVPGVYMISVSHSSGREAYVVVAVQPGVTTSLTIPLLAENGGIDVWVRQTNGDPAAGASVSIVRSGKPADAASPTTNTSGLATANNLMEGEYGVTACWLVEETVQLCKSGSTRIGAGEHPSMTLTLGGAGTIEGRYVEADGVTPVESVQVAIGNVAFAPTDAAGVFVARGIPLGTYTITGRNPVTGRAAATTAQVVVADQTVQALLREDSLGEVTGLVINSDGFSTVPGASVTLNVQNRLFPALTVTTDPSGRFSFTDVPPGPFDLYAQDVVTHRGGSARGQMPSPVTTVDVEVPLERRADLSIFVLNPDGTPAEGAFVQAENGGAVINTNSAGEARFTGLTLGRKLVRAHGAGTQVHSAAVQEINIATAGEAAPVTLSLSGTGTVEVHVLRQAGAAIEPVDLTLEMDDLYEGSVEITAAAGPDDRAIFNNVALGEVHIEAVSGGLGGSVSGVLARHSLTSWTPPHLELDLQLGESATVHGRLVRESSPNQAVVGAEVVIRYQPQNAAAAGAARTRTAAGGVFSFTNIPVGELELNVSVPALNGVLNLERTIESGDEDLGTLLLDQAQPMVLDTYPLAGAVDVPGSASVQITFSEEMRNTAELTDEDAVYITDGTAHVDAELSWSADGLTLFIDPAPRTDGRSPLASHTRYTVVVAAGEVFDSLGRSLGFGPVDLAKRPLIAPLVYTFTTADSTPPIVESFTPDDGEVQVAVPFAIRASFNEPMGGGAMVVSCNDAEVEGELVFGLGGRVAVFAPESPIGENSRCTAALTAFDLANLPIVPETHTFDTRDTQRPNIHTLTTVARLVPGSIVPFTATLVPVTAGGEVTPEEDAQIELSLDLINFATSPIDVLTVPLFIPASTPLGSDLVVHARAYDRFGNVGEFQDFTFEIAENIGADPLISIVRELPPTGALASGDVYRFRVTATDDSEITSLAVTTLGAVEAPAQHPEAGDDSVVLEGMVPEDTGAGRTLIVRAIAADDSGASVQRDHLEPIADGQAPLLTLGTISPSTRRVGQGGAISVQAHASDAFGVTRLRFTATGALTAEDGGDLSAPPATISDSFSDTVPANAALGSTINVLVHAADAAGHTDEETVVFTVADVTPPTLVSISPSDGATGVARRPAITATFSEPVTGVGDTSFYLTLPNNASAVAATVVLAANGLSATLTPTQNLVADTTYQVTLGSPIRDLASTPNALATTYSGFTTAPAAPPGPELVLFIGPADGETNVYLELPSVAYNFDSPIDLHTVSADDFHVVNLSDNSEMQTYFYPDFDHPDDEGRTLRFYLGAVLRPGTEYELRLDGTPTDFLGRAIVDQNGEPFEQYVTSFRASRVEIDVPQGDRVIEGERVHATVVCESNAFVTSANWTVDGLNFYTSYAQPPEFDFVVPPLSTRPSGTMTAGAQTSVLGVHPYTATRVLNIQSATADEDLDGASNGAELAGGTNPRVGDQGPTDDLDGDGLTNAQELAAIPPTRADKVDTDDDGLLDPVDPHPTQTNRAPGFGVLTASRNILVPQASSGSRYLTIPITRPPQFTIELWVRPSSTSPTLVTGNNVYVGYIGGSFFFQANGQQSTASFSSATNTWHHVAITYDGARFRGLVDGKIAVELQQSLTGGAEFMELGRNFEGYLDELRLWSAARSPVEIQSTMHRVVPPSTTDLVAAWNLDEGTGTRVNASNGNTALRGELIVSPSNGQAISWSAIDLPLYEPLTTRSMAGAGAMVTIGAYDFDLEPISLVVSELPDQGALYDGAAASGASPFGAELTVASPSITIPAAASLTDLPRRALNYVAGSANVTADQFTLRASDGSVQTSDGALELQAPRLKTWTGASSTAWTQPGNWSPAGVPASHDRVIVPDSASITVAGNMVAGDLSIGSGATITISADASLVSAGHIDNNGTFIEDGTLITRGVGLQIHGTFRRLRIDSGSAFLQGGTTVTDRWNVTGGAIATIAANATVNVGTAAVIAGTVAVNSGATLVATQGAPPAVALTVSASGTLSNQGNVTVIPSNSCNFSGTVTGVSCP